MPGTLEAWLSFDREACGIPREGRDDAGWRSLLAGEPEPPGRIVRESDARSLALAALVATESDRHADAAHWARRAVKLARSSDDPEEELMAGLTLARVRRRAGRPHLALHIVLALARVAPPAWCAWVAWELALAGAMAPSRALLATLTGTPWASTPAARAVAALLALLRDGAEDTSPPPDLHALRSALAGAAPFAREAESLAALLDVSLPAPTQAVRAFRAGEAHEIPCGMAAACAACTPCFTLDGVTVLACVLVQPDTPAVRVVRCPSGVPSLPDLVAARGIDENLRDARGPRTYVALCTLALAGEQGLPREEFFARVYGFSFSAARHQATLDVLLHRARALAPDALRIRREDSRIVLDRGGPLVLPDPRCHLDFPDQLLAWIAGQGSVTAQTAAEFLGMPLRTVHRWLRELIEDGAIAPERAGRAVRYRVEDTTFTTMRGRSR